jgi:NAD+ diphosphatase
MSGEAGGAIRTGQVSPEPAGIGGVGGPEPGGLAPLGSLALSRGEVDRATMLREDADWLAAAWADQGSRVVVVYDGQAPVRFGDAGAELVLVPPAAAPDGVRFLLGTDSDGVAYFGVAVLDGPCPAAPGGQAAGGVAAGDVAAGDVAGGAAAGGGGMAGGAAAGGGGMAGGGAAGGGVAGGGTGSVRWAGLRQVGAQLSARDAGLMTHAVALANWHAVAGHCPRCGAVTEPASAGSSRRCVADGSEHFPRSDPAVIMLVTDPDDRGLLARNAQWPERRVSILAGFVEAGESAEQAVAREVLEETGLVVSRVRYVGSQPWPMPHSLMLGFRAHAEGGQQIKVDVHEIAEARWYSRTELRDAIEQGEVLLPPPVSIAHQIIVSWYGNDLSADWSRPAG